MKAWQAIVKRFPLFLAWACLAANVGADTNAPHFSDWRLLTNKEVWLQFSAPTGQYYCIEVSTNLTTWESLVSFASTNAPRQHADSATPFLPGRFYRACQLTGSSFITGDHVPTPNGDLVIHPLSHASIVMLWRDKTIYLDVTNKNTGLRRADLVLFTHGHGDHCAASVITNWIGSNAPILAPLWAYTNLTPGLQAITTVLTNGAVTNVFGIGIEAVPMYGTNATPNHPKGAGNGYVLTFGGKRIYVGGDTHGTVEVRGLRDIDVAFVAMKGPQSNMSIPQAVDAVRAFRPKVVYPYHYLSNDPATFKHQLGTDLGIEVRLRPWY